IVLDAVAVVVEAVTDLGNGPDGVLALQGRLARHADQIAGETDADAAQVLTLGILEWAARTASARNVVGGAIAVVVELVADLGARRHLVRARERPRLRRGVLHALLDAALADAGAALAARAAAVTRARHVVDDAVAVVVEAVAHLGLLVREAEALQ